MSRFFYFTFYEFIASKFWYLKTIKFCKDSTCKSLPIKARNYNITFVNKIYFHLTYINLQHRNGINNLCKLKNKIYTSTLIAFNVLLWCARVDWSVQQLDSSQHQIVKKNWLPDLWWDIKLFLTFWFCSICLIRGDRMLRSECDCVNLFDNIVIMVIPRSVNFISVFSVLLVCLSCFTRKLFSVIQLVSLTWPIKFDLSCSLFSCNHDKDKLVWCRRTY